VARIVWTPQSLEDLARACRYIASYSPQAARAFAQRVFDSVERLELFPGSGRTVPEFERAEIREVIVSNYRIIYRYRDDAVEILTVYHGARLLDGLPRAEGP